MDLDLDLDYFHFWKINLNPFVFFLFLHDDMYGTGIPGDGRCLFRSVVHGACLREGRPSPSEGHERELADELRAKV